MLKVKEWNCPSDNFDCPYYDADGCATCGMGNPYVGCEEFYYLINEEDPEEEEGEDEDIW